MRLTLNIRGVRNLYDEDFASGELGYMASVGRHLMKKIDAARPGKDN